LYGEQAAAFVAEADDAADRLGGPQDGMHGAVELGPVERKPLEQLRVDGGGPLQRGDGRGWVAGELFELVEPIALQGRPARQLRAAGAALVKRSKA
jgi:hypothetical protein